tara:strand:+ start:655 stop:1245 length:591 start_codon:yes stop_codon:yes gene_type:complete
MSFRSETKFRLSYGDKYLLKSNLLSLGMKQLYPSRFINSQYFDTEKLKMFFDSEEGIVPRKKIRVRWYHKKQEKNLETKISSNEGRFKIKKKYVSSLNSQFVYDRLYGKIFPSILVNYKREYYNFKNLRLTFDSSINYTNLRNQNLKMINDRETVLEVKTNHLNSYDYISKFISCSTSRFSKYSRGIQLTKLIQKI